LLSRDEAFHRLSADRLDLLVIGGGVVGAGVARDAAMRGLRVGLVARADFASGTSSRTSRLLHGGLRYLAQGRLGLVRQSSREKRILHHIAPHLASPLPFVFPTYRATEWPKWKLAVGVRVYDLLCGGQNLGRSRSIDRQRAVELLPHLKPDGLNGGVRYFDGLTSDARLVLDTLRSAESAGAIALNYARHVHAERSGGAWCSRVVDEVGGRELHITSSVVVNATGPWVDRFPRCRLKLRPTKGVHIVIRRERWPLSDALVIPEGSRILFGIPWGERLILGTTDTDYEGDPAEVETAPEDVEYILRTVHDVFPTLGLNEDDVLSDWAGVRPLLADPRGNPSDISRGHEIRMDEPGWLDVAGGKLTTYRLMAEQTVDLVLRYLGRPHVPCPTAEERLLAPEAVEGRSGIIPPSVTREVVGHYVEREWAMHLDDVMVRRTSWHYYLEDRPEAARRVAGWMAEAAGWGAERTGAELAAYEALR